MAGSAVPGECTMRFDLKYLPSVYGLRGERTVTDSEQVKREVSARVLASCQADPWLAEHPLVQTFASAATEVMGGVRISSFPAGCDARHFALHGIPAVIFGPGDLRNAHNVDEHVSMEEYLLCLETVAHSVSDWCGVAK